MISHKAVGVDASASSPVTWSPMLLVLIAAACFPFVLRHFRKSTSKPSSLSSSSTNMGKKGQPEPTEVTMTVDPLRLAEPNFGYKDVRVAKILVHPIKSCRGTSVNRAMYTPEGLENDRKWCIIEADDHNAITAREVAKMVLIVPEILLDDKSQYGGSLRVSFPLDSGCEAFSVPLIPLEDKWDLLHDIKMWGHQIEGYICQSTSGGRSPSEILSQYFNKPVHLVVKGGRPRACDPTPSFPSLSATAVFQDGYPLLVASDEDADAIQEQLQRYIGKQGVDEKWRTDKVAIERFRPNIVFRGAGAFSEDLWEEISISRDMESAAKAPRILLVSKCQRCLLPNVSPETGVRDAAVPYKILMKFRTNVDARDKYKPCLGCNGVPLGDGEIRVGDAVMVRKLIGLDVMTQ